MNVPNIGQGIESVTTLPAQASGSAAAESRPSAVRTPARPESFSFTRLAWFDINGDGHIDPRAAGAGGDATLLVGSREVDLPTYSRSVHTVGDIRAFKAKEAKETGRSDAPTPTPTTAQTRQAIDAYQKYGQAPAADSSTPTPTPVPVPTPAPASPLPAVALPTAAVATDTPAPAPAPTRAVA